MCNHEIMRSVSLATRSDRRRRITRRTAIGGGIGPGAAATIRTPTGRARGQGDAAFASGQVIDLTHRLLPDFPVYPGYTPFSTVVTSTIDGIGSLSRQVTMEEHVGTHVDAPAHFIVDGDDVSAIPPERLVAPLAILDISARVRDDDDATVSVDDVLAWEEEHGVLPAGAFIAMRSGWDSRAGNAAAFLNIGNVGLLHFPAWSTAAAAFLVEEREIVGVGRRSGGRSDDRRQRPPLRGRLGRSVPRTRADMSGTEASDADLTRFPLNPVDRAGRVVALRIG